MISDLYKIPVNFAGIFFAIFCINKMGEMYGNKPYENFYPQVMEILF